MAKKDKDKNPPPPDGDDFSSPEEDKALGAGFIAELQRAKKRLGDMQFKVVDESSSSDDDDLATQQRQINEKHIEVLVALNNLRAEISQTRSKDLKHAKESKVAIREGMATMRRVGDGLPDADLINVLTALGPVATLEARLQASLTQLVMYDEKLKKSLDASPATEELIRSKVADALKAKRLKHSDELKVNLNLYLLARKKTEEVKLTVGEYKPKIQAALDDARKTRTMLIDALAKLEKSN